MRIRPISSGALANQPEGPGYSIGPTVLHVTVSRHTPVGIVNQLRDEVQAVARLQLPWRTVLLTTDDINEPYAVRLQGGITPLAYRLQAVRWVLNRYRRFDVLLLRHSKVDPVLCMVRNKLGFRISVHHAKEIEECRLTKPPWKGFVHSKIERYLGTPSIRSAKAVVGVTKEIVSYELTRIGRRIPAVTIPNGIDVQRMPLAHDSRGGKVKLLFVASQFHDWYGLDLVLDALEGSSLGCQLILVGLVERPCLKRIHSSARLSSTVILIGPADQATLSEWMSAADIGLSSFGLSRQRMKEASTLKVREYLCAGVPVYAGHDDAGLPEDFPFFCKGMPNIDTMIRQALIWRKHSRSEIRAAAEPWIDKTRLVSALYHWISSIF